MNSSVLKVIFTACFLFFLYAAASKILHAEGADTLLLIGLVVSAPCFVFVLYEVLSARSLKIESKILWLVGLFMFGWLVMLYYVFAARKDNNNTAARLRTT